LKWVGGKGQLVGEIIKLLPQKFNNYVEPFVGAGALFFALYSADILKDKSVILSDFNEELINAYKALQKNNGANNIIKLLSNEMYANNSENFYSVRLNVPTNSYERAARMIYLNKTCFNGLYRVNSKGLFNSPFGKYNNPKICDSENLKAVSSALKNVSLMNGDFEVTSHLIKKEDFVYFDPPYQPVSKTSNFTNYTKNSFGEDDQKRLFNFYTSLSDKGCKVMMSNSDAKLIRELYKNFNLRVVGAKRSINCKSSKRGNVDELIITNY